MLAVRTSLQKVRIGERFSVSFQRTLRVPDDGRDYPLPPGLGLFPIRRVADYAERVPPHWREHGDGGIFIPMHQREALWLGFEGAYWKPNAVKVGVGGVNAITGEEWTEGLDAHAQDYIVCPDQPWLDGINSGDGTIRQFVAMPLGAGYTVEAQLTGKEEFGGIQILVYEPKPGRFPDQAPEHRNDLSPVALAQAVSPLSEMGLAAGGKITQKIYPDPHGPDTWDPDNRGLLFVHIVNGEQYRHLTGQEPPPTPISAETYSQYGLPWFALYDETRGHLTASNKLSRVKTVREKDLENGLASDTDDDGESVAVREDQIRKLHPERSDRGS